MTDTAELKQTFWRALADSPFLFLQLDADPHTAVPMTAQLDSTANSEIWFFLARDHVFAGGGPATATFAGRGHDLFARFSGTLTPELSRERLEKQWSPAVEAWFPGGKDDPQLLMLRMDLTGEAEIWNADLGFFDTTRMLMGFDVREDAEREHTETTL
jgi:general stress protein 26